MLPHQPDDKESSTCIPPQRLQGLLKQRRVADIDHAREAAAQLLDEINRGGGPFAHPARCGCCGCRAAARWRNQQNQVA